MRLEIESVVVADSTGAESVGVSALLQRAARPVLRDGVVLASAPGVRPSRGGRPAGQPAADARCGAAGFGRSGSTATACSCGSEDDDGDHDVRLPFAKPVDDVTGLSQAIRILMGCPFLNGLRARDSRRRCRYRSFGDRRPTS